MLSLDNEYANTNKLKSFIDDSDLNDTNVLKQIKREISYILKDKKQKKIKKKINTDLDH